MDENRAHRVVDALRERGVPAHVARVGVGQIGIQVRRLFECGLCIGSRALRKVNQTELVPTGGIVLIDG